MIAPDGSLRCSNCDKEIMVFLEMTEGRARFYCPRCHYYEEIKASTAQVIKEGLINSFKSATIST